MEEQTRPDDHPVHPLLAVLTLYKYSIIRVCGLGGQVPATLQRHHPCA